MRIFASWSGEESKQIAELLKSWIPSVIQDADVYVSSQDIGKGERWLTSVGTNLAEIDFGIIVVTKTNINAPWILFEAGALSKSVKGVVIPLLCGVETLEAATSPLTQFQYARAVENEMRDLILQVNSYSTKPMDQTRVETAFHKWWPDFVDRYKKIELPAPRPAKKETDGDRLAKIEEVLGDLMLEVRRQRRPVYIRAEDPPERIEVSEANAVARREFHERSLDAARRREIERHRLRRQQILEKREEEGRTSKE